MVPLAAFWRACKFLRSPGCKKTWRQTQLHWKIKVGAGGFYRNLLELLLTPFSPYALCNLVFLEKKLNDEKFLALLNKVVMAFDCVVGVGLAMTMTCS